jgi:O-antigen/teichoic acid export membrane protein
MSNNRIKNILLGSASLLSSTFVTFLSGFILAGIIARFFTPDQFGLWGILISLNGIFINGFDLGFGNALRNKIAQLNAVGKNDECRLYYFSVFEWFLISAIFFTIIFIVIKSIIPWNILLKSENPIIIKEGATLFIIGCVVFAFNIAFNLYSSGFFGFQESHFNAVFNAVSKLSVLAVTVILVYAGVSFFNVNIITFAAIMGASITGFLSFLCIRKWQVIIPNFRKSMAVVKELWRKSAQFALLQVFSIVLMNADIFVVSASSGLTTAGDYFVVKRLYLIISTIHFALMLPLWSAYTESMEKKEYGWIKNMLKKTVIGTFGLFLIGIVVLTFLGEYISYLWTGKRIDNIWLYLWMGVWSIMYGWNNCFSILLNALGRLKRQVLYVGIGTVAFFPVGILLGELYGAIGICIALVIVSIPITISNPIESFLYIKNMAS